VIHLAGETVVGLWTQQKKNAIKQSRAITTKFLSETLQTLSSPPKVCLFASGINYYYDKEQQAEFEARGETPLMDENFPQGKSGFLNDVTKEWEDNTKGLSGIRTVNMRISVVLARDGGMLQMMYWPFLFGLGGVMGSGKQYFSWIHIQDVLRAIEFILENENISGGVNFASPNPVTNYDWTKGLGSALWRPTLFWIPSFILKTSRFLLNEFVEETILVSLRTIPKKLLDNGFKFQYPDLQSALKDLCK